MANFFPRWSNWLPLKLALCAGVTGTGLTAGVWYYFTPKYTRVGYMPAQPVAFSHDIHANQLGMDCRYCHSFVEVAAHSNVPNTQVCMNCHTQIQNQNPKLQLVRDSYANGYPLDWVQIHKTPDYVYFNHSVHVNRGVSCYSCHGPVNKMPVVYQHEPQSMSWCLDCHRAPENYLRPTEQVFNLNWKPQDEKPSVFAAKFGQSPGAFDPHKPLTQQQIGLVLKQDWNVNPPQNCAGCHR